MGFKEYYADENREQALVKVVRKTAPQWIVGNIVAGLFALLGVALVILVLLRSGSHGAELFCLIVAVLLFPVIGILISSAVARKGGRDILLARLGEKLILTEEELIESYTPRFKQIDASALVENHIDYSSITSIVHQKKTYRIVIYGRVTVVRQSRFAGTGPQESETDKIVLYDYFSDMSELLHELERRSGMKIQEEN